jgi:A nuclease family of the HNH/ENDO VII superfamily with conserved AHH
MAEMSEGVAALLDLMEEDVKCEFKPKDETWTCILEGDADRLGRNIKKHREIKKPQVPKTLADVSSDSWPSQAHHLIPWQQLDKHPVIQWLAESKQKLLKDTYYSVDHGRNGKFMPYASDLPEWSSSSAAKKRKIAEKVMQKAGIQLHQGPHSYKPYGVGEEGYKTRVAEYLDAIHDDSGDHYVSDPPCKDCKAKSKGGKRSPRANVVRYMDAASGFIETDINVGRVFVSRRAADFVEAGGLVGDDA